MFIYLSFLYHRRFFLTLLIQVFYQVGRVFFGSFSCDFFGLNRLASCESFHAG